MQHRTTGRRRSRPSSLVLHQVVASLRKRSLCVAARVHAAAAGLQIVEADVGCHGKKRSKESRQRPRDGGQQGRPEWGLRQASDIPWTTLPPGATTTMALHPGAYMYTEMYPCRHFTCDDCCAFWLSAEASPRQNKSMARFTSSVVDNELPWLPLLHASLPYPKRRDQSYSRSRTKTSSYI